MLYGCCTNIEHYKLVANCGYNRIILPAIYVYSATTQAFSDTQKALQQGTVKCNALNDFCTPQLKLSGPGFNLKEVTTYTLALVKRAAAIGVKYIGIGAPKSKNIPPGFDVERAADQFESSIAAMCEICHPFGIDVLLEAVCDLECNFITTTDEALQIVEKLGEDNLHLTYDVYHAYMMNENASPLRRAMKHVKLVHVAQNIGGKRHYLRPEIIKEYKIYFDALKDYGFEGEVSVEAFYDNIEEQLVSTLSILKTLCE